MRLCGRKTPLPFPLLRSGHISAICAVLSKEMVIHKRVETLVSTLLRPRGVSAVSFASKAKNHRLSKNYRIYKGVLTLTIEEILKLRQEAGGLNKLMHMHVVTLDKDGGANRRA